MGEFDDDKTVVDGLPAGSRSGLPARVAERSPDVRVLDVPATRERALEVASSLDIDFIEIDVGEENEPETGVLRKIPREIAERYRFFPIRQDPDGTFVIAVPNPLDPIVLDVEQYVTFNLARKVRFVVALQPDIHEAISTHYGFLEDQEALKTFGGTVSVVSPDEVAPDRAELARKGQEADIIAFVDGTLLPSAVKLRASDIHFEPQEKNCRVRFRVDGRLRLITTVPVSMRDAVISRIKILASLDITERRSPQDGRIRIRMDDGREIDFRVATAPTLHGEKVVLRVLDQSTQLITLEKLGFSPEELEIFRAAIRSSWGMVLVTGPTGSGKTTTLAAALHELNGMVDNIQTIEDPVEIPIPGISQTSINVQAGMTFANGLRAFLRMDPDIIMVGEIRDFETAEIAVRAASTGHLVLSTLHTNDAAATISRLLRMGIEPFILADMLNLVVAQRLVRRVCDKCTKEPLVIERARLLDLGFTEQEIDDSRLMRATGQNGRGKCRNCNGSGYKGRAGLYEMLQMTDPLRQIILRGADSTEIRRAAIKAGMKPLKRAGVELILSGVTTFEEVLRVTRKH